MTLKEALRIARGKLAAAPPGEEREANHVLYLYQEHADEIEKLVVAVHRAGERAGFERADRCALDM